RPGLRQLGQPRRDERRVEGTRSAQLRTLVVDVLPLRFPQTEYVNIFGFDYVQAVDLPRVSEIELMVVRIGEVRVHQASYRARRQIRCSRRDRRQRIHSEPE